MLNNSIILFIISLNPLINNLLAKYLNVMVIKVQDLGLYFQRKFCFQRKQETAKFKVGV